jgi:photosystem II stability/assembly factor-like uncharacterized protein
MLERKDNQVMEYITPQTKKYIIILFTAGIVLLYAASFTASVDEQNLTMIQLNSIYADQSTPELIVVGENGVILRSSDSGKTWNKINTTLSANLTCITGLESGEKLMVVGENGSYLESLDKGQTWVQKKLPTSNHLMSISMSPKGKEGLIVGEKGTILRTTNNGRSWNFINVDTSYHLFSVSYNEKGNIIGAVGLQRGEEGQLPKGHVYITSNDGGKTWNSANSSIRGYPYKIKPFWLTDEFVMCGSHGSIGNSAKQGTKWIQTLGVPTQRHLNDITVHPKGWFVLAVGDDEIIIRYNRSNMKWAIVNSRIRRGASLLSITFLSDMKTVVAVGGPLVIWRSTDSGTTWEKVQLKF